MEVAGGIFLLLILCFFWSETFWSVLIGLLKVTVWALLVCMALCLIFGTETGLTLWLWLFSITGAIIAIAGILIIGSFVLNMVSDRPGCK